MLIHHVQKRMCDPKAPHIPLPRASPPLAPGGAVCSLRLTLRIAAQRTLSSWHLGVPDLPSSCPLIARVPLRFLWQPEAPSPHHSCTYHRQGNRQSQAQTFLPSISLALCYARGRLQWARCSWKPIRYVSRLAGVWPRKQPSSHLPVSRLGFAFCFLKTLMSLSIPHCPSELTSSSCLPAVPKFIITSLNCFCIRETQHIYFLTKFI